MTTMVALVGEQTLPNFLPARQQHPDNILLVYTKKTQQFYEYLRGKLQMEGIRVFDLRTDPYKILTIVEELQGKLNLLKRQGYISTPLIFNLTGGTKIMSLAAYQVAAQDKDASVIYMQSETVPSIINHYGWQGQQLIQQKEEIVTEDTSLRDMLELHLGPMENAKGEKRWGERKPTANNTDEGLPFEQAIKSALGDGGYETLWGIHKEKGNSIEIDVAIGYKNQIGIIEAKLDGKKLEGIKQLSYAMQYLKATYTKQFIVVASPSSEDLERMCKTLKIHVIQLPRYKRGPNATSLSDEDRKILLAEVDKVMGRD
ncbi:MAG TPA: DUF1887 family CARF protein [Ktedonobacteraceae bacterium]|nr:DUF1887 family CARF protein [Ktedonobacteraceae bacterium]